MRGLDGEFLEVDVMRPRYTDDFRAQAIALLQANGWPDKKGALVKTAASLDIAHQTLSRWAMKVQNPPPPELVQEKSADLATVIRTELDAIFLSLPHVRSTANYKELMTGVGILIDKLQLLQGNPTERHEHVGLSFEERNQEIATLLERARERQAAQAAERARNGR
jgi:transposase-like protein